MESLRVADSYFLPSPSSSEGSGDQYHIVFVPGNPGLISYYRSFLSILHSSLNSSEQTRGANVFGCSLAGFEVRDRKLSFEKKGGRRRDDQTFFGVEEQIRFTESVLLSYATNLPALAQRQEVASAQASEPKPKIILVGHSFGTYIILRILENYHDFLSTHELPYEISSAILLFPTVIELAKSPNGRRLGRLFSIGRLLGIFWFLNTLKQILVWIFGTHLVSAIVKSVATRGKPRVREVEEAAETAFEWIKSKRGVGQCLYMAADEMVQIGDDNFSSAIWPLSQDSMTSKTTPRLFFYFGRDDAWVAASTRDYLMSRGVKSATKPGSKDADRADFGEPHFEVDQHNVPHEFIMGHSKQVARKVAEYIGDMS